MKRLLEKKVIMMIVFSFIALALAGCAKSTETDYVAALFRWRDYAFDTGAHILFFL